jgi:small subunit ribosomal protein S2
MSIVTMKQLLEAGVHFGHQTHKWNPKMKKFIFIKRNGIHILDLKQTVDSIHTAFHMLKNVASKGESVLFVGTKKQAQDAVKDAATKADASYVNFRWYGGMLTNMTTIRRSVEKMEWYEQIVADGTINSYTKLEQIKMKREHEKIERSLGGIRKMDTLPGAVVVVDTNYEAIAVHEARILGIPIIGMVDTNCDPDSVDYVIPSNDDAIRAIDLIVGILAQAVIDGKNIMTEGAISTPVGEEQPEVIENVENQVEEEDINMDAIVQEIDIKEEEIANKEGE